MSSAIKIQYSLNLPEGINTEDKPTSKTHQLKIDTAIINNPSSNGDSTKETKKSYYYDALRNALEEARNKIGDELTVWRDCVGKKEPRKGNGDEEEDEVEEGWFLVRDVVCRLGFLKGCIKEIGSLLKIIQILFFMCSSFVYFSFI